MSLALQASSRPDSDRLRIRDLEDQIDELRETVRQLEDVLAPQVMIPHSWGLTPSQRTIFGCLLVREAASHEQLRMALESRASKVVVDGTVKAQVCKMRGKFSPYGVVVKNFWGVGYALQDRVSWRQRLATVARMQTAVDQAAGAR